METITAPQTTAPTTIDADAAARLARLQQRRTAATRPAGTAPKAPEQARRRRHAAKGSRIAALSLSVLASSGLTVAFASADRSGATPVSSSTAGATASSTAGATAAKASTTSASKTFTGVVDQNKWGPVQVKITTSGGKITNVAALQTPNSKQKSVNINNRAVPVLKSEAIAAQNALIDNVSGATYTTDSYKVSLQSAIDKAVASGALAAA